MKMNVVFLLMNIGFVALNAMSWPDTASVFVCGFCTMAATQNLLQILFAVQEA